MTEETKVTSPKPDSASPKKKAAPKKAAAPKAKKAAAPKAESGPSYIDLIIDAITSLKERTGSSRQAISKYVSAKKANFASHFLNKALRSAVDAGKLVQVKGSYKVAAAQKKKAAPKKAAAKKPASKKAAKPAAKKAATKKVSAKKAPAKKAAAKPKKVTAKAAKKVTKKAKTSAKK